MIWTLIAVCAVALGISFLCSLMEAVLLSLNPFRLKAQHHRGVAEAGSWLFLKQRIERPISAILILNTLANTGLATVAGAIFVTIYSQHWLWAFSLGLTLLVLFGTELIPKIIGVNHNESVAPFVAPPLRLALRVLSPLTSVMERLAAVFAPRRNGAAERSEHIMDIITLTQAAKAEKLIHSYEEIIIIHAATLSARRVQSIMVPRESIRALREHLPIEENLKLIRETRFDRYPISDGDSPDDITTYVDLKELACAGRVDSTAALSALARPILSVSPNASLTALLALFLQNKGQLALVRAPSGRVAGLVTLDDVTELIIGDKL